jgi:imidazole glycerol-phosphate synthase subunit HisH
MLDVAIVDLNLSNLHSVNSACKKVGLKSQITSDKNVISKAKSIIFPGVGSFKVAMKKLRLLKLEETIKNSINYNKPFLGVCLGMQLLFSSSNEFGSTKGMSIFKGEVKKFDFYIKNNIKFPVPHVGWNKIYYSEKEKKLKIFKNIKNHEFMYFVHSYYVVPENKDIILTNSTYGIKNFCSSIMYKNIYAFQFHPEKSGLEGLKIYRNFRSIIQKI